MFPVEKDEFGYIVSEEDLGDAPLFTAYAAIGYNDPTLLDPMLKMIRELPPDQWYRHPRFEQVDPTSAKRDGKMSRDQLTFIIAACKYFGIKDVPKIIDDALPLFSKIGGRWYCTPDFKHFLRGANGRWYFPWMLLAGISVLPFHINNFVYHLYAWWLWCLPDGLTKKLGWAIFNLNCKIHGFNIFPWHPSGKNLLYMVLQGEIVPQELIDVVVPYNGISWEKGEGQASWYRRVELTPESYELDKNIIIALNNRLKLAKLASFWGKHGPGHRLY